MISFPGWEEGKMTLLKLAAPVGGMETTSYKINNNQKGGR